MRARFFEKGAIPKCPVYSDSLHGNIACCTVAFASGSNIFVSIGKQIVYRLTLADYQVPIQFKVKHMGLWLPNKFGIIHGEPEPVGIDNPLPPLMPPFFIEYRNNIKSLVSPWLS